jgi:hypothetical protein
VRHRRRRPSLGVLAWERLVPSPRGKRKQAQLRQGLPRPRGGFPAKERSAPSCSPPGSRASPRTVRAEGRRTATPSVVRDQPDKRLTADPQERRPPPASPCQAPVPDRLLQTAGAAAVWRRHRLRGARHRACRAMLAARHIARRRRSSKVSRGPRGGCSTGLLSRWVAPGPSHRRAAACRVPAAGPRHWHRLVGGMTRASRSPVPWSVRPAASRSTPVTRGRCRAPRRGRSRPPRRGRRRSRPRGSTAAEAPPGLDAIDEDLASSPVGLWARSREWLRVQFRAWIQTCENPRGLVATAGRIPTTAGSSKACRRGEGQSVAAANRAGGGDQVDVRTWRRWK